MKRIIICWKSFIQLGHFLRGHRISKVKNAFINWFFYDGVFFVIVYIHISFDLMYLWLVFYFSRNWILFKHVFLICEPPVAWFYFSKLFKVIHVYIFMFIFYLYFLMALLVDFFQFFFLFLILSLLFNICWVPYKLNSCCEVWICLYVIILWKIDLTNEFLIILGIYF